MKCIVCEKPTFMSFRLGDVEASFCPEHLPKNINTIHHMDEMVLSRGLCYTGIPQIIQLFENGGIPRIKEIMIRVKIRC